MVKDNKTVEILVNGVPKTWPKGGEITYAQLVDIAFPGSTQSYIVTYKHGHKEVQLVPTSPPVKVKDGMEFDVDATDNS